MTALICPYNQDCVSVDRWETVQHYLLECHLYKDLRRSFYLTAGTAGSPYTIHLQPAHEETPREQI